MVKMGWIASTRPRSSAIACSVQPGISSAIPISHVPWPARWTNDPGCRIDNGGAFSPPRCCRTVERAKMAAATSASVVAMTMW
jgi:hypothetical protein